MFTDELRIILTISLSSLLFACGGSGGSDNDNITTEEFRSTISEAANTNAVNCGEVQVGVAPDDVDQCIVDAHTNGNPAYAIYFFQGIDSTVARGVVLDSARSLRFWNYDSFRTGRISTYICGLGIPDKTQYFKAYLAVCLDRDNPAFVPFTEFEQMVAFEGGESATNCGVAEVDSVLFDINQCIVDAFILQNPAYSIYKLQGIDSLLAEAISISESGVVKLWFYDSNISGGGELILSLVDNVECELPEVNSDLEVPLSELFTCI